MESEISQENVEIILEACGKLFEYKFQRKDLRLKRLGGLTNYIYETESVVPGHKFKVLSRIFGDSSDLFSDRKLENKTYTALDKLNVSPKMLFVNERIRIEEFIEFKDFEIEDLYEDPIKLTKVAFSLAKFHSMKMPGSVPKKSLILHALDGSIRKDFNKKCRQKGIYSEGELKMIEKVKKMTSMKMMGYVRRLCQILGDKNLVMSHNDLHSQNLIIREKDEKIFIIDFDFVQYNFRSYDIANFFSELQFDYTNPESPYFTWVKKTKEIKKAYSQFLMEYLVFSQLDLSNVNTIEEIREMKRKNTKLDANLYNKFKKEIKIMNFLCQWYWVIWGVLMGKDPNIKFDYVAYAYHRSKLCMKQLEPLILKYNLDSKSTIKKQKTKDLISDILLTSFTKLDKSEYTTSQNMTDSQLDLVQDNFEIQKMKTQSVNVLKPVQLIEYLSVEKPKSEIQLEKIKKKEESKIQEKKIKSKKELHEEKSKLLLRLDTGMMLSKEKKDEQLEILRLLKEIEASQKDHEIQILIDEIGDQQQLKARSNSYVSEELKTGPISEEAEQTKTTTKGTGFALHISDILSIYMSFFAK